MINICEKDYQFENKIWKFTYPLARDHMGDSLFYTSRNTAEQPSVPLVQ